MLEDILSDQQCGATFIFKVLTTPFFDEKMRPEVVPNVRSVLVRIKAQPNQGYKRLMDEVGLPTRNGHRDMHRDDHRPSSKHSNNVNGHMGPGQIDSPMNRQYYPMMMPGMDPTAGMQRTGSMESGSFEGYPIQQSYPPAAAMGGMPTMNTHPGMQYPQPMMPTTRPGAQFLPPGVNMNAGYSSSAPSIGNYRDANSSPMGMNPSMIPQGGYNTPPPSFGMGTPPGMFPGYPHVQQQFAIPRMAHGNMGAGRRRVSALLLHTYDYFV